MAEKFVSENSRPLATHLPFWMHEEVRAAVYGYVCNGDYAAGPQKDLRGATFTVTVSEDGLTITVEEKE